MSGLDRFVAVLALYNESADVWSVQEMANVLDVPASTVYRIVRDLVNASFLEPATGARYRLGSAFPRYDRLARNTDPVVRVGGAFLQDVVSQARIPCVALLSRLCNDMIMCVAHRAADNVDFEWSLFERGRPIPLTRGATSKVILAQIPMQQRRKLLAKNEADTSEVAAAFSGKSELLTHIRKQGYHISHGEIDPSLVAIAAPISVPEMGLAASISLILEADVINEDLERRLVLLLLSSAGLVSEQLRRSEDSQPTQVAAAN